MSGFDPMIGPFGRERRRLIAALGGAALAWPLGARAQPAGQIRLIGFLGYGTQPHMFAAFLQGLRDLGHDIGRTIYVEERHSRGQAERLDALAADLARLQLDLVVVDGTPSALAAKRVFGTRPIVFALAADPVHDGLVASLARPGGNLTGVTFLATDLSAKRLQLLKDTVPRMARVGLLYNPSVGFTAGMLREVREACESLGLRLENAPAAAPRHCPAHSPRRRAATRFSRSTMACSSGSGRRSSASAFSTDGPRCTRSGNMSRRAA